MGPLPDDTVDPQIMIEWDIFIDADSSEQTGLIWPFLYNDTGPDYHLYVSIKGTDIRTSAYNTTTRESTQVEYVNTDSTIEVLIPPEFVENTNTFNCVFVVRKYRQTGSSSTLIAADKAPNNGYLRFPDGYMYVQPGPPTAVYVTDNVTVFYNLGNEERAIWYAVGW